MANYRLKRPARAARYDLHGNEREVFDLLNLGDASFTNVSGLLLVFNNRGKDVNVQPGQGVVRIGGDFNVLDDAAFVDLFEPTEVDP